MKKNLLFLLLFFTTIIDLKAQSVKLIQAIVPYNFAKHARLLALCAQQHYPHIFSNSRLDPCYNNDGKKYQYGLAQASHLALHGNDLGQIINNNGSITTTKVLELDNQPIGYIKYTAPHPLPNTGSIDQLAMLDAYKNKGLAKFLVWDAFDNFYKNPAIFYATLITTTQDVGEKFYQKKIGFTFSGSATSAIYPDETLYRYTAKIRKT